MSGSCPTHLLPAAVILDQDRLGVVEHSFAYGRAAERVRVWWSGKWTNGPTDALSFTKGAKDLRVWNIEDPDLPIEIDWDAWLKDNEPVKTTLSGVKDKYKARNALFIRRADLDRLAAAAKSTSD